MKFNHYDFCIVGAGPSGLTAAYKLLQQGFKVLLIERDGRVGGLAKSHDYEGHIFDTGPKRFHTDDPVVLDFIREIASDNLSRIGRSTEVHFLGRYFNWPLTTKDLFKLPVTLSFRCILDLLQKRNIKDRQSFHEFIRHKYGENLYQVFFKPYTSKFLRWDVEDIHSDWATTGINRTVVDKRIKSDTLKDLLQSLLLPTKIDTEFLYPLQGGFGGFYELLLARCRKFDSFDLLLNDAILGLENKGKNLNALTKSTQSISFNQLIWTGNLNDLCRLIGALPRVHYLNTIFYNIICKDKGIARKKAQWIYVSQGDSLISRITCMNEFAAYTTPRGYYNLICELTDSQQAPVYFENPQKYSHRILNELEEMSFLKHTRFVDDIKINLVRDTYPIYHKKYHQKFAEAAGAVKKFSPHIHLLGRSGAFWYNNSDHSIRFAIELAKRFSGKPNQEEFDYRHYFGGESKRSTTPQGIK